MHKDCIIKNNTVSLINEEVDIRNSQYEIETLAEKEHPTQNTVELSGETYFLCCSQHNNIGHFFHDQFFPFYVRWREHKRPTLIYVQGNNYFFDFVKAAIGEEYATHAETDASYHLDTPLLVPTGRNLPSETSDYVNIIHEIRDNCFNFYNITANRTENYMFSRIQLERKKLLELDQEFLANHDIKDIPNLHTMAFGETLEIFAQTKCFIYMVGAGTFYKVFFDKDVDVLEINPCYNNSWADFFGLKDVCRLHLFISQNTEPKPKTAPYGELLNAHVYFDEDLKKACADVVRGDYKTPVSTKLNSEYLRARRKLKSALS